MQLQLKSAEVQLNFDGPYCNSYSTFSFLGYLHWARSYSVHHTLVQCTYHAYTHPHAFTHTYMPFTAMHIPHMMDRSPIPRAPNLPGNPDGTCTMDLTMVMPPHIQSSRSAFWHQTLPHLPSLPSSCPLPSIPSTTRVELHIPSFSLNNNQHHPIYNTNNNQHCPIYDTNPPSTSHNHQYCLFYNTNFSYNPPVTSTHAYNNANPHHNFLSPTPLPSQQYLLPLPLPTLKELSMPSSPMYIPILTGRSDWCPWSDALTTAVIGMNLFGHIAEDHDSQWGFDPGLIPTYLPVIHQGFDPGSIPTYLPVIHQNSSPKEFQAWNIWWIHDGQVLHLLVSWLSPNARSQLPGAGTSQP